MTFFSFLENDGGRTRIRRSGRHGKGQADADHHRHHIGQVICLPPVNFRFYFVVFRNSFYRTAHNLKTNGRRGHRHQPPRIPIDAVLMPGDSSQKIHKQLQQGGVSAVLQVDDSVYESIHKLLI